MTSVLPPTFAPGAVKEYPSELDYNTKMLYSDQTIYIDCPPQPNTVTLALSSEQVATHYIQGQNPIILADSILDYDLTIPSQGSTQVGFLSLLNSFISQVVIQGQQSNQYYVQANNVQLIQKMVLPYVLQHANLQQMPRADTNLYRFCGFAYADTLKNTESLSTYDFGRQVDVNSALEDSCTNFRQFQSHFAGAAANASFVVYCSVPLFILVPHSILSLRKALTYGEVMIARISFAPTTSYTFSSTGIGGGGAFTGSVTTATVVNTIANINLRVCSVSDQDLIKTCNDKFNAGIRILLPWVQANVYSASNATTRQDIQIASSDGSLLQRVYSCIFVNTQGAQCYNNNNGVANINSGTGALWQTVRSFLNGLPESNGPLSRNQVYDKMRMEIAPRGIIQNQGMYNQHSVYCSDYTCLKSDYFQRENVLAGLELTGQTNRMLIYTLEWIKRTNSNDYLGVVYVTVKPMRLGPLSANNNRVGGSPDSM